ncbi:MAG: multiheme c-type cytochrome, partial [Planctomycetia bacterium]
VAPPRALLGAGSCTSSGCHAAAVEGHLAWQSSYTVWATRDPHARAERVLHEPLAARIVELLAVRNPGSPAVPAHEHTACIGCHATGRGPLAREGVGCESCHGPAGDWLVAHTLPGWRTRGNGAGMVDLADPFVCAQTCGGCHVGGPPTADGLPREVSHDLIAAGHPRLAFELRSFKQAEPPHWRDRFTLGPRPAGNSPQEKAGDSSQARAIEPAPESPRESTLLDPLDEWALGRLGTIHVFLDQVARQAGASTRPRSGATADTWPEFTAFDCYGCHRPPVAGADRGGAPAGASGTSPPDRHVGTPRLEPLQWSLLDLILPAEQAATLEGFRRDTEARWWERPDAATILACLDAIDAARAHGHPALAGASAGVVARRVVDRTTPATWDEATAALAALEAVAARAASRGVSPETLGPVRGRLATLRGLLEFPAGGDGSRPRFDSPRDYDWRGVARELAAIAAALEAVR